jgi:hypothetical protein
METADKFNGQSCSQFLKHLLNQYIRPIILIEDGAGYHGGKIVNPIQEIYKNEGSLFVHRLPSHAATAIIMQLYWFRAWF